MWPWGHLAVGYLLYSLACRYSGRTLHGDAVILTAFGTQFPDLIDKPLGWNLGLLPSGRSLAHSLFTAFLVIMVVGYVTRRRSRDRLGWAFGLGYLSHLTADGLYPLLEGKYEFLTYLGWPLLPIPPYEHESRTILEHFLSMEWSGFFAAELVLTALALGLWLADGRPGVATVKAWVGSVRTATERTD